MKNDPLFAENTLTVSDTACAPLCRGGSIIFGIYGAGGFAREVMPLMQEQLRALSSAAGLPMPGLHFIETHPTRRSVNGCSLVSEDEFFALACHEHRFNIAIGDSKVRQRIAEVCIARGANPFSIISPLATVYDFNEIGQGAILCAHSVVTSNARIGRFFHANIFSYVAHDCIIGDYVTFAPSVKCNGNVHVHDHAYIGTGAIIKQGSAGKPTVIGEGAVVGMGAVVTKDVPAFTTVVGNPARPMIRT